MNVQAIIEGFKNLNFPTKEHEALAMVRAEICGGCEFIEEKKSTSIVPGTSSETNESIKYAICGVCKCVLSAKVRQTLESCPKDKW